MRGALIFVVLTAPASAAVPAVPFPMAVEAVGPEGVTLRPDPEALAALAPLSSVVLTGVPLTPLERVDLELDRIDVVPAGAVLAVDGFRVPGPIDEGLTMWHGEVRGDSDGEAFLALSVHGCRGFVRAGGRRVELAASARDGDWSRARSRFVPVDRRASPPAPFLCRAAELEGYAAAANVTAVPGSTFPKAAGFAPILEVRVAVETDFQFYQRFLDLEAAETYALTLIGAVSSRFLDQVGVVVVVPYLGLYTSNTDPWTQADQGGSAVDVLYEFRDLWKDGGAPVAADLHAMLSGANLGGGIAWVNVLCSPSYGFSVSGNLSGSGVFPPVPHAPGNWDFDVVAHELGHNFGSPHTHDYCPTPLDECAPAAYFGACQASQTCLASGTIMSYCHLCPGGMANKSLQFHPAVVNVLRTAADQSCLKPYQGLAEVIDLGHALAGSAGAPALTLAYHNPSHAIGLDVTGAPASQAGLLFVGASLSGLPFLGGTLVPEPAATASIASDLSGAVGFSVPFPTAVSAPAGATLYAQAWFEDPAGPHGVAASNGLQFSLFSP